MFSRLLLLTLLTLSGSHYDATSQKEPARPPKMRDWGINSKVLICPIVDLRMTNDPGDGSKRRAVEVTTMFADALRNRGYVPIVWSKWQPIMVVYYMKSPLDAVKMLVARSPHEDLSGVILLVSEFTFAIEFGGWKQTYPSGHIPVNSHAVDEVEALGLFAELFDAKTSQVIMPKALRLLRVQAGFGPNYGRARKTLSAVAGPQDAALNPRTITWTYSFTESEVDFLRQAGEQEAARFPVLR